jgi:hypothetical protein
VVDIGPERSAKIAFGAFLLLRQILLVPLHCLPDDLDELGINASEASFRTLLKPSRHWLGQPHLAAPDF